MCGLQLSQFACEEEMLVRPQTRKSLKDENFEDTLKGLALEVWSTFKNVSKHFLGNQKW